jgi:hypothetical protein
MGEEAMRPNLAMTDALIDQLEHGPLREHARAVAVAVAVAVQA